MFWKIQTPVMESLKAVWYTHISGFEPATPNFLASGLTTRRARKKIQKKRQIQIFYTLEKASSKQIEETLKKVETVA